MLVRCIVTRGATLLLHYVIARVCCIVQWVSVAAAAKKLRLWTYLVIQCTCKWIIKHPLSEQSAVLAKNKLKRVLWCTRSTSQSVKQGRCALGRHTVFTTQVQYGTQEEEAVEALVLVRLSYVSSLNYFSFFNVSQNVPLLRLSISRMHHLRNPPPPPLPNSVGASRSAYICSLACIPN